MIAASRQMRRRAKTSHAAGPSAVKRAVAWVVLAVAVVVIGTALSWTLLVAGVGPLWLRAPIGMVVVLALLWAHSVVLRGRT